jgi:hypothetical protein
MGMVTCPLLVMRMCPPRASKSHTTKILTAFVGSVNTGVDALSSGKEGESWSSTRASYGEDRVIETATGESKAGCNVVLLEVRQLL